MNLSQNMFGRDTAEFLVAQGARTKVCFTYSESEATMRQQKFSVSFGCGDFIAPLRSNSVAVGKPQLPRCALRIQENLSQRG